MYKLCVYVWILYVHPTLHDSPLANASHFACILFWSIKRKIWSFEFYKMKYVHACMLESWLHVNFLLVYQNSKGQSKLYLKINVIVISWFGRQGSSCHFIKYLYIYKGGYTEVRWRSNIVWFYFNLQRVQIIFEVE